MCKAYCSLTCDDHVKLGSFRETHCDVYTTWCDVYTIWKKSHKCDFTEEVKKTSKRWSYALKCDHRCVTPRGEKAPSSGWLHPHLTEKKNQHFIISGASVSLADSLDVTGSLVSSQKARKPSAHLNHLWGTNVVVIGDSVFTFVFLSFILLTLIILWSFFEQV